MPDHRPSAARRGYGRRWQATSKGYLASHPRCVRCHAAATVVDHVVPHRGDMRRFWDPRNWQALCAPCHNAKTARERGAA